MGARPKGSCETKEKLKNQTCAVDTRPFFFFLGFFDLTVLMFLVGFVSFLSETLSLNLLTVIHPTNEVTPK
jgi:hypothetical protein